MGRHLLKTKRPNFDVIMDMKYLWFRPKDAYTLLSLKNEMTLSEFQRIWTFNFETPSNVETVELRWKQWKQYYFKAPHLIAPFKFESDVHGRVVVEPEPEWNSSTTTNAEPEPATNAAVNSLRQKFGLDPRD